MTHEATVVFGRVPARRARWWLGFVASALALACVGACSHGGASPTDGGADVAPDVSAAAMAEALATAGDLELAHERFYACHELPHATDVWEGGMDRACFVNLMARHLDRQDQLSECIRNQARERAQCGGATSCGSTVCSDAVLLDDTPIRELVNESCGGLLGLDGQAELNACARVAALESAPDLSGSSRPAR